MSASPQLYGVFTQDGKLLADAGGTEWPYVFYSQSAAAAYARMMEDGYRLHRRRFDVRPVSADVLGGRDVEVVEALCCRLMPV